MFGSRKHSRPSLLRRGFYLLLVLSSGGGLGTYFKDHPYVQAVVSLFSGTNPQQAAQVLDGTVVAEVTDAIEGQVGFAEPGTYQVVISSVELDPKLFKAGHTLDIQARVVKLEPDGHDETVFETREYGERLATAGRDELAAGWPHRPFHVNWQPGQSLVVEVFDRKTGLFAEPMRFVLAPPSAEPREFPLKTGTFILQPARESEGTVDPARSRIVLESQRLNEQPADAPRVARDDSLPIN